MTATDLLREAGEALYGARWQSDLARDLDVSDRTVRRWAAGDGAIPAGVIVDLRRICEARAVSLDAVILHIVKAVDDFCCATAVT